jgi:protein gp37
MSDGSRIEWCDATWNPVVGCQPMHWSKPRRILVGSMSDVGLWPLKQVGRVILHAEANVGRHTFMLLTKRPDLLAATLRRLWSPRNLWIGVTVENNAQAWRIEELLKIRPAIHFVSFEPLLERIDVNPLPRTDWNIAGPETGPGARPCDPTWIEELDDRCMAAGIPFFDKRAGGRREFPKGAARG